MFFTKPVIAAVRPVSLFIIEYLYVYPDAPPVACAVILSVEPFLTSVAGAVNFTDKSSKHTTFTELLFTVFPEASFTSTNNSLFPAFAAVHT